MKFIYFSLLLALTANTVYNYTISKREDCESQLNEYSSCFNSNSVEEIVQKVCVEKCHQLIEFPKQILSKCKGDENSIVENLFNEDHQGNLKSVIGLICAKDEGGQDCPIVKLANDGVNFDEKGITSMLEQSCQSKLCSDALISLYLSPTTNIFKEYKKEDFVEKLNSSECRAQNMVNENSVIQKFLNLFAKFF